MQKKKNNSLRCPHVCTEGWFDEQKNENGTSILFNQIFNLGDGNIDKVSYGLKGASLMSVQKWDEGIEMTSMSKQKGLLI